ncbi:hypothetical protein AAVH_31377 [Aphelenchoides avenae]|nr:hypothetical protein AAVH_31377 [Aphelenchus avenae]
MIRAPPTLQPAEGQSAAPQAGQSPTQPPTPNGPVQGAVIQGPARPQQAQQPQFSPQQQPSSGQPQQGAQHPHSLPSSDAGKIMKFYLGSARPMGPFNEAQQSQQQQGSQRSLGPRQAGNEFPMNDGTPYEQQSYQTQQQRKMEDHKNSSIRGHSNNNMVDRNRAIVHSNSSSDYRESDHRYLGASWFRATDVLLHANRHVRRRV